MTHSSVKLNPTPRASLGNLPEEILLQILDESTSTPKFHHHDGCYCPNRIYSDIRSLSLVCHRFHRLATPFLYENITLYHASNPLSTIKDCSMVPPCRRAKALHRVLRDNPHLRARCQLLEIIIDDDAEAGEENFEVARDLLSWLGRTKSLRLFGGFREDLSVQRRGWALDLIRAASRGMPGLKELLIEGDQDGDGGLSLVEAMEVIDFPVLEGLVMFSNGPSDPQQLSRMLQEESSRTASFTSLTLKYCKDTPEAIEKIISWPRKLVDFTINTSGNRLVDHVSLSNAQEWLSIHKESLQYLYIDLLGHDQGLFFDASVFPQLEGLRLSRTQLNDDDDDGWNRDLRWEPSHADRILSPKLKTFGMSFGILGCCLINNFGEKEVQWLRSLGQAAASRKSALDTIEILFDPLSAYPHKYGNYPEDYGYPWDRIQGLSEELARCGIQVVYNNPPWTKEEWECKIARWLGGIPDY